VVALPAKKSRDDSRLSSLTGGLSSLLCRDSSRHFFADARHSAALFVTPAVFAAGSLFSRDKKQITGGETAGVTAPTPHSQLRMRVLSRDREGAVVAGE